MALLTCNIYSEELQKKVAFKVIFPQNLKYEYHTYPVLYLLHGFGDDETTWERRTSIERYADEYKLIIVMPDGQKSYYTDMVYGGKFHSYLTKELPKIVKTMFPISDKYEDTFIVGNSMGGYGSLKAALLNPGQYSYVGLISAVTDMGALWDREIDYSNVEFTAIYGSREAADKKEHNLFTMIDMCDKSKFPNIVQICGANDELIADNRRMREHIILSNKCKDYTFIETEGGHDWGFWDAQIKTILNKLPL